VAFKIEKSRWEQEVSDYRVSKVGRLFQPEMLYITKGNLGGRWVPLNREGYWADPDCYSTGVVVRTCPMRKAEAERAVWRAMKVNRVTA
jgi:hypothetical protein